MVSDREMESPLASSQRESAGSDSYDRFEYQYHWALCQAFSAYCKTNDFAVFMEYHEDIIIADSLDKNKVKFTFNQIKANATGSYTTKNLTKREKSKKSDKPSLLGKLCSSVHNKKYLNKVTGLNFVSTVGFNFTSKDGMKLRSMGLSDLEAKDASMIIDSLSKEITGFDAFPKEILKFVYSDIPLQSYYEHTITRITDSVETVFPKHLLKAKDIYRVLMDSLRIRGKDNFDYDKWDEVIAQKAITYDDIHDVVTKGISNENSNIGIDAAKFIIEDLELKGLKKARLLREVSSYSLRVLSPSLAMLDAQANIKKIIEKNQNTLDEKLSYELLRELLSQLPFEVTNLFESEESLIAAAIYEMT